MRIVSGIQPTGVKHLGNYFGAMRQHLDLQDAFPGECFFFIADYHALTAVNDPEELARSRTQLARTYLALGLDPEKACLFRQSDVPEVTEISWLLSTVTSMGLLQRAHSYKDKVAKGLTPNVGLFTYPVLMSADILAYGGEVIPVGKDQVQHVEMTKDMAQSFNARYGEVFTMPEARLTEACYVPGLDGQKMSTSYGNTIPIFSFGKPLRKLISKIKTDSTELGSSLTKAGPLYELLCLFQGREHVDTRFDLGSYPDYAIPYGYGNAKMELKNAIEEHFAIARDRALALSDDDVMDVLIEGAGQASSIAQETLERCRDACGLVR